MAKKYIEKKSDSHIPYVEGKQLTGTAKYASVFTHMGVEQSRRDDMESLGYVLIYLLKGELPWSKIKAKNKQEKHNKIRDKKIECVPEILCQDLPSIIYF